MSGYIGSSNKKIKRAWLGVPDKNDIRINPETGKPYFAVKKKVIRKAWIGDVINVPKIVLNSEDYYDLTENTFLPFQLKNRSAISCNNKFMYIIPDAYHMYKFDGTNFIEKQPPVFSVDRDRVLEESIKLSYTSYNGSPTILYMIYVTADNNLEFSVYNIQNESWISQNNHYIQVVDPSHPTEGYDILGHYVGISYNGYNEYYLGENGSVSSRTAKWSPADVGFNFKFLDFHKSEPYSTNTDLVVSGTSIKYYKNGASHKIVTLPYTFDSDSWAGAIAEKIYICFSNGKCYSYNPTHDNNYRIEGDDRDLYNDGIYSFLKEEIDLPYKPSKTSFSFFNNGLYMLGGTNGKEFNNYYIKIPWVTLRSGPQWPLNSTLVVHNEKVHMLGGPSGRSTQHIEFGIGLYGDNCYKTTNTIQHNNIPYIIQGDDEAVSYNNSIYVFKSAAILYKCDENYNWSQVSTPFGSLNTGSISVYNGKIHIIGKNVHYTYDEESWVQQTPIDSFIKATVNYRDKLYCICSSTSAYDDYKIYSWDDEEWEYVCDTPFTRVYGTNNQIVVLNNKIHFIAFGTSDLWPSDNYNWYREHVSWDGENWNLESYLTDIADYYPCSVVYDNKIILATANINGWWVYSDDKELIWSDHFSLPYIYSKNGSSIMHNGNINILGGDRGSFSHYSYNKTLNKWSKVSLLPYSFKDGSVVVYDNKIHILGGSDYKQTHYSLTDSSWSSESNIPYDFYKGSAVVHNNKIHILGGYDASDKHYSWDGSSWSEESVLPSPFVSGSAAVYNGYIHILGKDLINNLYFKKFVSGSWIDLVVPSDIVIDSLENLNGVLYAFRKNAQTGRINGVYKYSNGNWSIAGVDLDLFDAYIIGIDSTDFYYCAINNENDKPRLMVTNLNHDFS